MKLDSGRKFSTEDVCRMSDEVFNGYTKNPNHNCRHIDCDNCILCIKKGEKDYTCMRRYDVRIYRDNYRLSHELNQEEKIMKEEEKSEFRLRRLSSVEYLLLLIATPTLWVLAEVYAYYAPLLLLGLIIGFVPYGMYLSNLEYYDSQEMDEIDNNYIEKLVIKPYEKATNLYTKLKSKVIRIWDKIRKA